MSTERSLFDVTAAFSSGCQKLGQPVRLSNLVSDENRASWQPAQANVPARCSLSSGLEKGRSVPCRLRTAYCADVRSARHSASVCVTLKRSSAAAAPPRSEEHTSELQSHLNLVCRLLLEKKNKKFYLTTQLTVTLVNPCRS